MPAARNLVDDLEHLPSTPDVLAMVENAKAGHYDGAPEQDLARDLEALNLSATDSHGRDFMVKQARLGVYKPSAAVQDPDGFRRSPPDTEGEAPAARADDPPQPPAPRAGEEPPAEHSDSSTLPEHSEPALP